LAMPATSSSRARSPEGMGDHGLEKGRDRQS
jgi:hypothetical protein